MAYLFQYRSFRILMAFAIIFACTGLLTPIKSNASDLQPPIELIRSAALKCIDQWDTPECMKHISAGVLYMAVDYSATLEQAGQDKSIERLKEHCAAATVAIDQEIPAYAMQSAYTDCANVISVIFEETEIKPHADLYQLLVGTVMCMNNNHNCDSIEQQLAQY